MTRRRCTKIRYFTRRAARRARRVDHLRGEHMQAYYCVPCLAWHLGHVHPLVLAGVRTKDEVYVR
jgi:hypothetical protein